MRGGEKRGALVISSAVGDMGMGMGGGGGFAFVAVAVDGAAAVQASPTSSSPSADAASGAVLPPPPSSSFTQSSLTTVDLPAGAVSPSTAETDAPGDGYESMLMRWWRRESHPRTGRWRHRGGGGDNEEEGEGGGDATIIDDVHHRRCAAMRDEQRVKTSMVSLSPVDYVAESRNLLKALCV